MSIPELFEEGSTNKAIQILAEQYFDKYDRNLGNLDYRLADLQGKSREPIVYDISPSLTH